MTRHLPARALFLSSPGTSARTSRGGPAGQPHSLRPKCLSAPCLQGQCTTENSCCGPRGAAAAQERARAELSASTCPAPRTPHAARQWARDKGMGLENGGALNNKLVCIAYNSSLAQASRDIWLDAAARARWAARARRVAFPSPPALAHARSQQPH